MALPHPSGLAVAAERVTVASTRNPNQLVELAPAAVEGRPLVPVRTEFHPGSLYLHDLAYVGGVLHGNAVGQNAVVRLDGGRAERVWWPKAIETEAGPDFSRNYLQLNSIAAGPSLEASFFSASAERMSSRRPGHRNFPVDGRGVVFSGATREPVVRGLTRPHSARLHEGRLWVESSGYGELGVVEDGRFEAGRAPAGLDARARVPRRPRVRRHLAGAPALPHVRAGPRPRSLGVRGLRGRYSERRGASARSSGPRATRSSPSRRCRSR